MALYNEITVIGGGAAGLAAAITAARRGHTVAIVEKNDRVGKKLLATGNGKCNFTNMRPGRRHYHGTDPAFSDHALAEFSAKKNIEFFRSLGILPYEDSEGRVYPMSRQAASVLEMMRLEVERRKIKVLEKCRALSIEEKGDRFRIGCTKETIRTRKVIVATGGMAAPDLGGGPDGYDLMDLLGHSLTKVSPALVKVRTDNTLTSAMKGIRVNCGVLLRKKGVTVSVRRGEVLFTDYGLSGLAIMELSRLLCFEDLSDYSIDLDFFPDEPKGRVLGILRSRRNDLAGLKLENYLTGIVPKRVGQTIIKDVLSVKLSRAIGSLQDTELKDIGTALKNFSFPITGLLGWTQAQVTAGGLVTDEFDAETMESRLVPGVYAAGEILDIDGDCGGYNLQWAWSSGRLAGLSAAIALEDEDL